MTTFRPGLRTLGAAAGTTNIVLAITATRVGALRIDGVDVHYLDGVRYGHAHSGYFVTARSKQP